MKSALGFVIERPPEKLSVMERSPSEAAAPKERVPVIELALAAFHAEVLKLGVAFEPNETEVRFPLDVGRPSIDTVVVAEFCPK